MISFLELEVQRSLSQAWPLVGTLAELSSLLALCELPSLGLSFPIYTKKEIDELGRNLPAQSVISVGSLYKHVSHSFKFCGRGRPSSLSWASSPPSWGLRLGLLGFPAGWGFSCPELPGSVGKNANSGFVFPSD